VTRPALVLVLVCALATACSEDAPQPRKVEGLPGSIVDVNGHYLYFRCVGDGTPTVVLEAGFGGSTENWEDVQPQLGRSTRTCSYDRAGLGGSAAIEGVHDAADEIRDLAVMLERAKIEPPYVLVGHSYGGVLVRLFAHEHPDDVAGLVLVDSSHPDQVRRNLAAIPREPRFAALRRELADSPRVVDGVDVEAGFALDRPLRSFGDTPLVVLTAGIDDMSAQDLTASLRRAFRGTWLSLQDELAALSSESVHAVASRSDHFIQTRARGQPGVVVRAVRALLSQAELNSCADVFQGLDVRCRS
jgi:pimeloyl-ACP methyl ester carboxylesterase